jgi:hypothetical protein
MKMRFFLATSLLAVATAFTTQPNVFTTVSSSVGERSSDLSNAEQGKAHHERRSTIVMDGKANGEWKVV